MPYRNRLSAVTPAGCLATALAGGAAAPALADYGTGAQYQVEISAEAFGMIVALLNAGSATVVASVARVADQTAMTAMVAYHRAITTGISPAAALAAGMQQDMTAGFVCFGAG